MKRTPQIETRYNSKDGETTYKVISYDPKKGIVTYRTTNNEQRTTKLEYFSKLVASYEKR